MKGSKKETRTFDVNVTKAREVKDGVVVFDMEVNGVNIYSCWYREYITKEGKEGTMISFPQEKAEIDGETKYFNRAWFPISNELKDSIIEQLQKVVK